MTRPRRRLCAYVPSPVTTDSPSSLCQATSLPQLSLQLLRRAPSALALSPEVSKKLHLPTGSVALSFLPRSPTPDPWQRRDVRGPGAAVSASLPGARAGAGRRHPEPAPAALPARPTPQPPQPRVPGTGARMASAGARRLPAPTRAAARSWCGFSLRSGTRAVPPPPPGPSRPPRPMR